MAITLGGIMRGALPRLSQRISDVRETKEAAVLRVGERFAELKDKVNEAEAKNRTYMTNVEAVAKSLAMDKDVVYNVFKVYGGNNKSSMNHLKNLANAYVAKGKPIPTMAVLQTEKMLPAKEDKAILAGMPADQKELSTFDKAISLFKTASPDEVFQEFMKRNPQLDEAQVRQIMKNTVTPGYSPGSVIDPKAFIATLNAEEKNKKDTYGRYTYLTDHLKTIQNATITTPGEFEQNQIALIAELPKQLSIAQSHYKNGEIDKAEEIFSSIESTILGVYPKAIPKGEEKAEKEIREIVDGLMANNPGADRVNVTSQVRKMYSAPTVSVDGAPAKLVFEIDDKGNVSTKTVILDNYQYGNTGASSGSSIGKVSNMKPKEIQKNVEALKINSSSMANIGSILGKLENTPLAFVSSVDKIVGGISTTTDIMNSLFNTNVDILAGTQFDAQNFQTLNQQGIKLIAAAKDQLFNDPRLSDRDLAIVLDYVAVIQRNIGSTQAIASLYGLQTALLKDSALRIAQNDLNIPIDVPLTDAEIQANVPFKLEEDGKLINENATISTRLMHTAARAMGFQILTTEQANSLSEERQNDYFNKMDLIASQVKTALTDIRIYKTLTGDQQRQYAGKTTGTSTDNWSVVPNSSNKDVLRVFNRPNSFLPNVQRRT